MMMKGVSKQILEVTNTENPYFEKIIFFVKSEHSSTDYSKLKKEAEAVAATTQKPPKLKVSRIRIIKATIGALLFTLSGCAITLLVNYLM